MTSLPTPIAVVYLVGWVLASVLLAQHMTNEQHYTGTMGEKVSVGAASIGVGMGWPVLGALVLVAWVGEKL